MQAQHNANRHHLPVDWSTLHKVLRDETRKKIILQLHSAGTLAYTDLMNQLEITNTGSLNYHLKKLNSLIEKKEDGGYTLTEKGVAAAELLEKLPSQISSPRVLRTSDALLIGLLGFLLILLPAYAEVFATSATLGFLFAGLILSLYPLFVPSSLMWLLTVRRTNSHDLYDLAKPPVAAAGMFYLLQLLLFLIQRLNTLATSQLQPPPPTTTTTQTVVFMILPSYVFLPWTPLLGLLLIEGVYRLRNR